MRLQELTRNLSTSTYTMITNGQVLKSCSTDDCNNPDDEIAGAGLGLGGCGLLWGSCRLSGYGGQGAGRDRWNKALATVCIGIVGHGGRRAATVRSWKDHRRTDEGGDLGRLRGSPAGAATLGPHRSGQSKMHQQRSSELFYHLELGDVGLCWCIQEDCPRSPSPWFASPWP